MAGFGVTSAAPPASNPGNPFQAILDKLDQVLARLSGSGGNHTLQWDTNNPSGTRFTPAFPGAVLDNNTGLVWEQATDGTATHTWYGANTYCLNKKVPATGGTKGWRLPSVVELASVQDPSLAAPFVPATVFSGVQSAFYWSASSNAVNPSFAWYVFFFNGFVNHNGKTSILFHAWCVRGPMSESAL
jgi:hypothetical protein